LADRFIVGVAPIDYGPVLLLKPFGFHLAMDTLPSGVLARGGSRSALAVSGFRLRARVGGFHTFRTPRPARRYPRFWIWRSSFERQRDFNPPEQRAAQHTLRSCPTSWSRASSAYAFRLPDTVRGSISRGQLQDLPVPTHDVSERAQGLRPRGVRERLAMATFPMWPSAYSYSVGTPEQGSFAAEYLARPYLGRRFGDVLTDGTARLEAGVGR
jgi:hypothetical protein